jgi:hypothetical protein
MSWLARHRRLAFAAICTFWTAVVFVGHFFPTLPFISIPWRGEQGFEDLLRTEGRKTATRDDFIFLGIDQQSEQLDAVGSEEIAGNRAFELMTERPFPMVARNLGPLARIACLAPVRGWSSSIWCSTIRTTAIQPSARRSTDITIGSSLG